MSAKIFVTIQTTGNKTVCTIRLHFKGAEKTWKVTQPSSSLLDDTIGILTVFACLYFSIFL